MQYFMPVLILSMLSLAFVGTSYAIIPAPSTDPTLPQISLQLVVRNSQGQLVAYLEPSVLFIRSADWTHDYLNLLQNKTTITKDNQTFYEYEFGSEEGFDHFGQYAQYGLPYNNDLALVFNYNGFLAGPGDTLDIHWRIVSTS
ncbi:MAG: hypothetical protein WA799_04980 [Nitrosotalea sp.]